MTSSNNKMITEFKKIFNCGYFTTENKKLFKDTVTFGWFEYNNSLFIINYEYYAKNKTLSLKQAIKYYNIAKETEEFKKYNSCYLIVGCGTKPLKCEIYSTKNGDIKKIGNSLEYLKSVFDNNITSTDETLEDLKIIECKDKKIFDPKIAHAFNQYLHDNNIKMTIHIKTFFATSILLCRKANPRIISFLDKKDNGIIIANYLVELLNKFYKDELLTQQFKFMEYNLNNTQLYNLIKMLDFDIKEYSNDILNQFYSEFMIRDVKGNNKKSKKGIILTPYDIVELMVRELDIKKGDSVADFCTGTGSFLIEASKYTDNLIGCEKKEDLYTIAKSNFILHDLNTDKIIFNNCFNQKFEMYNHIILNPPFGIQCDNDKKIKDIYNWRHFDTEQKFIIYQLQHLKENGTGCFIIPRSNISNSDKTEEFKKVLLENCQILKVFTCNDDVFYPNASVECVIIVIKKCKPVEKYETEIIDYTNDGYIISKKKRIKETEPVIKKYRKFLKITDDWKFDNQEYLKNTELPDIKNIQVILLNNEFQNKMEEYESICDYSSISKEYQIFKDKLDNLEVKEPKELIKIKLTDLLEYLQVKKYSGSEKPGLIPLYGATIKHLPTQFIDNYSYDTSEAKDEITRENGIIMINNTGNGGAGLCFIHKGKFAILNTVTVFKMKQIIDPINAYYIGEQLHKIYNHSNSFSLDKFKVQYVNYIIFK